MPKILFTRTPSEAEGGPSHKFVDGGVFEVSVKSARRWIDEIGCAVSVQEEPKDIFAQLIEELGSDEPVGSGICDLPVAEPKYEMIESGGEAPPVIVDVVAPTPTEIHEVAPFHRPINIDMRHSGRGMYHVFVEGKQITEKAIPREEASALAEKAAHADDLESGADLG